MTGPIERHSASITIRSDTSLDKVEAFTQQMGANEKLRGIRNDDGSITLYATDKKASFLDKLTGKAADRSQAAREAISTVMRGIQTNNPEALGNITEISRLMGQTTGRSPKTDTFASMIGLIQKPPNEMPKLSDLPNGGQSVITAITSLANRLDQLTNTATPFFNKDNNTVTITDQGVQQDLAALSKAIGKALSDPGVQNKFPDLANGKSGPLLDSVMNNLREQLGGMLTNAITETVLFAIGQQTVERGLGELLPNKFTSDDTLMIGNQTYDRGKVLGEGAFGKVYEFVPRNGGDSVAVKFMKPGLNDRGAAALDMAVKENDVQQKANGTGDPNVLKGMGLARVGDGTMAIITEIAPHGDAMKLMDTIKDMVKQGVITQQQGMLASLTIAMDMANGLSHMHSNGLSHVDFKPMNVFIGTGGTGKVADFGTGTESRVGERKIFEPIDAPYWQSPEVLAGKENSEKSRVPIKELTQTALERLDLLFASEVLVGGSAPKDFALDRYVIDKVTDDLESLQLDTQFDGSQIDPQMYDAFALGVSIFNAFFESTFVPGGKNQFMFEDLKALNEFYEKGIDPIGTHSGALHVTTGFPEVDNLINQLMKSDPSERMTVTQATTSNAFNDPRIGSTEVRNLMVALTSGDPVKVRQAALLV